MDLFVHPHTQADTTMRGLSDANEKMTIGRPLVGGFLFERVDLGIAIRMDRMVRDASFPPAYPDRPN